MKQSTANTGFPTVVGDSIRYKTELGEISLLRPYGRIQQYEIYCIEGDLFEGIELFDTLEEAEARINNLLKEDEMWIKTTNKEPQVGQQVITYHQLNRIDILTFDGESFDFPITCPIDEDGNPIGWLSCYPKEVITHWMELPGRPK